MEGLSKGEAEKFHSMDTGVEPDPGLEFVWTAPTHQKLEDLEKQPESNAELLTPSELEMSDEEAEIHLFHKQKVEKSDSDQLAA